MIRILNLYSGIGGNRKLWKDCEVTAIEIDGDVAHIYKDNFPKDKVLVIDAHEYLLNNFHKYDFVWSSPPCQTHSSFRQNICVRFRGTKPVYPDMRLYQEILFLQYNSVGKLKWVIENVRPYYEPLIKPTFKLGRHLFWSNFNVDDKEFSNKKIRTAQIPDLQEAYGFDLSEYKISNKRQILRNCINPDIGLYILNHVRSKNE